MDKVQKTIGSPLLGLLKDSHLLFHARKEGKTGDIPCLYINMARARTHVIYRAACNISDPE
jgi:hypothetical protein